MNNRIELPDGTELLVREKEILEFHDLVMEFVEEYDCTYLEAIEEIREQKNIEPVIVGHLLSPILRDLLRQESEKLNLIEVEDVIPSGFYD